MHFRAATLKHPEIQQKVVCFVFWTVPKQPTSVGKISKKFKEIFFKKALKNLKIYKIRN